MNILIYWGVVLAGAVTLLIEAYRNFNTSLASVPFKEHPILQNVEIAKLSTTREKNFGFAFYSLLYLVTYAVVLSSAEIYELLRQAARVTEEVGPTDSFIGAQDGPLNEAGYGKPIFISAAIIAIFSVGALRPVESTMRSLSHRLAGIPRGVYRVIDDLHKISYQEYYKLKCPKPLARMFKANAERSFRKSFDAEHIDTVLTALLTIDYLAPAITGKQRVQHFPFAQLEAMSDLSEQLENQVATLRKLLATEPANDQDRARIYAAAMAAANDSIALFAVHYLRNNRAIKNFRKETAIAAVYQEIRSDYQVELNSFGMGLLTSFVAAFVTGWLLVYHWNIHAGAITPDSMRFSVQRVLAEDPAYGEAKREACLASPPPPDGSLYDRPPDQEVTAQLEGAALAVCHGIWKREIHNRQIDRRQGILIFVLSEIVPVTLAVALAALSAILGRDVRREDNSWPDWPLRRVPFLRLFSLSVIPAALAVLGITLAQFIALWINADFHLTENQMTFFFESKGPFFLMNALIGFVVAIGVLVLMDQHDRLYNEATLLLGAFFGVLALMAYYLIVLIGYPPDWIRAAPDGVGYSFEVRETLLFGSCAAFFLLFFSVFLEITEDVRPDRRSLLRALLPRRRKLIGKMSQ